MKGYAKVYREDMIAAVIGHGVRMDLAKGILKKGIDLYYDKYYTNGTRWIRWRHKGKTPKEFARSQLPAFYSWHELLYVVLDKHDTEELSWWAWSSERDSDPVNALYKTCTEYAWVDQEMAAFINKYKHWLENCK